MVTDDLLGLVIFAALAVVIIIKFNSILGKRFDDDDKVIDIKRYKNAVNETIDHDEEDSQSSIRPNEELSSEMLNKLDLKTRQSMKEIMRKDRYFSLEYFLDGAKSAYEMIITAFSNKDKETLRHLLTDSVYHAFSKEIETLEQRHQRKDMTIISILSQEITDAKIENNEIIIQLRFSTEQIIATYNDKDEIVEGSKSDIQRIDDDWTFKRPLNDKNPNWVLCETD